MAKNFPSLMKDMNINMQEVQQTPSGMTSKKSTLRHIIIKLFKDKERILNAIRGKQLVTNQLSQ